MTIEHTMP